MLSGHLVQNLAFIFPALACLRQAAFPRFSKSLVVAFDGADFYIVGGESGTTERLGRMATDGSSSVILATMPAGGGGSVAVDDECVYWSNALGIFSLAKTAEGPFAQ